ncbi:hypothetical protein DPMN_134906 [Dreissena polymorpha]|uniref:DUF1758 domain-containing protein n=1 Tax=Dreissena polymorpha TaxID=45954 RepID=A0A9D4JFB0_DREPO|nr:hypothetical protein DPMN_134906 [Dreissena polymorpha]
MNEIKFSLPREEGISQNVLVLTEEIVFMQTTTSEVTSPANKSGLNVRLLFDSGSQRSYVTARLAEKLELEGKQQEIKLLTFGSKTPKVIKTLSTQLNLKLKNGEYMTISANIVPEITGCVECKRLNLSECPELQQTLTNVDLADTIPT